MAEFASISVMTSGVSAPSRSRTENAVRSVSSS